MEPNWRDKFIESQEEIRKLKEWVTALRGIVEKCVRNPLTTKNTAVLLEVDAAGLAPWQQLTEEQLAEYKPTGHSQNLPF